MYFFKRFRSLNDENLGTVGQRAANALSNRPHFNSTYLVSGRFHSKITVSKQFLTISNYPLATWCRRITN